MRSPNDLWEAVGSLAEDETAQVLTRLVVLYADRLEKDPEDPAALLFFRDLDTAVSLASQCNLNRR
ncbi:MAG: hypothetical protein ACYCYR_08310 [Desulfobulbaceae bacterium]